MPFIIILISQLAFAQKKDTLYYDKDWKLTEKSNHEYYRIIHVSDKRPFYADDYKANGSLYRRGSFKSVNPDKREGQTSYYFENGKKKQEEIYLNNNIEELTEWDEAGNILQKYQIFNSYEFIAGKLEKQKIKVSNKEELTKNIHKLNNHISKKIPTYSAHLKKPLKGEFMALINISATGKLLNIEVVQSIDTNTDNIILKILSEITEYTPAQYNQKYIDYKALFRIKFS